MNRALEAAASGMAAQQRTLDVVADNLANADVAGFKGAVASFAALGDGALGTTETRTTRLFTQGKLERTGGPFDVAIDGAGFFAVERDGARAYTRAGSFSRDSDGRATSADGWHLAGVRLPADAATLDVRPDGAIVATDGAGHVHRAGTIRLATFAAPENLEPLGSALFVATPGSGPARRLDAGGEHRPAIRFGMLEKANVSIVESMMAILAAQRAYEADAKGVQAADEMLRIANNLHRS